ncbi:MAG: hypothetical protein IT340_00440 [Chloroflexi bacterium]|nr:hypothetical protein [Chloroflexota bacterium]
MRLHVAGRVTRWARIDQRPRRRWRLGQWLLVALVLGLGLPVASAAQESAFGALAFERAWRRTEAPVAAGRVSRPWLWGAAPLASLTERFDDAGPSGQRLVLYFDKGRMDLPPAGASDDAPVQSGALVRDLALGLVQVGSNQVLFYDPAFIPVAGDDQPGANLTAPRYADFALEAIGGIIVRGGLPLPASAVGRPVTATIQAGARGERAADAEPRVTIGAYDAASGHNIAAPFWDAFAAEGLVVDPITGGDQQAPLFDWRSLAGAPLSEPAWTTVQVGGQPALLLVQLFERRVLTYRPDAPPGWRVEMGNVGRHAHQWRYGPPPTAPPAVGLAPLTAGSRAQRLSAPPVTPATPIAVDRSLPPSVNGAVAPGVAPGGIRQVLLARGFRTIHFIDDTVGAWLTAPSGRVISLNDDTQPAVPIRIADETADGVILTIDTLRLAVGVWALTLQADADPARQSILYFRVTVEPREVSLAQVLSPLFWLTADDGGDSLLAHAWQEARR